MSREVFSRKIYDVWEVLRVVLTLLGLQLLVLSLPMRVIFHELQLYVRSYALD